MTRRAVFGVAPCALVAAIGLSGCGSSSNYFVGPTSPLLVSYQYGVPTGTPFDPSSDTARWAANGRIIIVSWGSGNCPTLPASVKLLPGNVINVTMASAQSAAVPSGAFCQLDLTGITSVIESPPGLDPSRRVVVEMSGDGVGGMVTLPPMST